MRTRQRRRSVGWMFRAEQRIEVRLKPECSGSFEDDQAAWNSGAWRGPAPKEEDYKERVQTFEDSNDGATLAAKWVTEKLGRDDWALEDMAFLGYRVIVPMEWVVAPTEGE